MMNSHLYGTSPLVFIKQAQHLDVKSIHSCKSCGELYFLGDIYGDCAEVTLIKLVVRPQAARAEARNQ